MARKHHNPLDIARQALKRAAKSSARQSQKLSREFARTRAQAIKQAKKNAAKETVAQWRALKRYGYITTTQTPSLKHLTSARSRKIKKAFVQAQSQAGFIEGKVVRPLQRKVEKDRIKYDLSKNFRFLRTKNKPSQRNGYVKTKKGLIFEALPEEKITVTRKGIVKRDLRKIGGFITESRSITGEAILKLGDDIRSGKFKLPAGYKLQVHTFGSSDAAPYDHDTLDLFAAKLERYENTMMTNIFQAYLDETQIFIKHR